MESRFGVIVRHGSTESSKYKITRAVYPSRKQSMPWNNSGQIRTHCVEKKADKMSYMRGASLLVLSLY